MQSMHDMYVQNTTTMDIGKIINHPLSKAILGKSNIIPPIIPFSSAKTFIYGLILIKN